MHFSGLTLSALLIVAAAAAPAKRDDNKNGENNNDENHNSNGDNEDNKTGAKISTLVDLDYTKYQGVQLAAGVNQYLGLRYAAPPLGNLRFRAPADPLRNESTQNAVQVYKVFSLLEEA